MAGVKKGVRKSGRETTVFETYHLEVEDWSGYYRFGIVSKSLKDTLKGAYWEKSEIILQCRITSPTLKSADKANLTAKDLFSVSTF
ncbi:hypothetical protein [Desulfatitalea tepidiphila]|uniref:hypothetical protein n=1 Tax=Desulfatitalea tepidiphila TaxID=1185843 RepID=UPI0006B61F19|nr:hypothetical protein [Desulfatitalea tepidiphila]